VLFALFRLSSETHDADRVLLDNLLIMAGAVLAGCVAIYFVVTGKKEDALPNLLRLYRGLLTRTTFLWLSNLLGTALVVVVLYKLALFRQVEFISQADIEVYLNDRPGQHELVGILKARMPVSFRLPIGEHLLVFRDPGSEKVLASTSIAVPSLVQNPAKVRKPIAATREQEYGKAR
jgi:hypothetical protein